MRTKKLEDILNKKQFKKVVKIVNSNSSEDVLSELKLYFKKIDKQLENKGVYHGFLAWVVYAILRDDLKE